MIVKLLTEHHLEFLSLKGGCRGSSESTLVKMSSCWKSHTAAQIAIPKKSDNFQVLCNETKGASFHIFTFMLSCMISLYKVCVC